MKIRKVRLRNLNSLRKVDDKNGKTFDFDFTAPPLNQTGLFAIVGETGAGKTTILDAITLALYGKVHRNKNEKEVMSYGAADCMAEIEFEVKQQIYRSIWRLRRARNKPDGNLQTPTRELSRQNTKTGNFDIIFEGIRNFETQIKRITGLDFDQFCRSVLLAQGDFAAFLKAEEKERSELLERITGTGYYSRISIAAFDRHTAEKAKLEKLQVQLEQLDLLPSTDFQELRSQFTQKKEEKDQLKKEIDHLQEAIKWHQQLTKLHQQLTINQTKLQQNETQWTEKRLQFDQLERYEKAAPFQLMVNRLEELVTERHDCQEKIGGLGASLIELQQQEQSTKQLFEQVQADYDAIAAQRESKEALFNNVNLLDQDIKNWKAQLKKLTKDLKTSKTRQTKDLKRLEEETELQETTNALLSQLGTWLQQHEGSERLEQDLPNFINKSDALRLVEKKYNALYKKHLTLGKKIEKQLKEKAKAQEHVQHARSLIEEDQRQFYQYVPSALQVAYKQRSKIMLAFNQQANQFLQFLTWIDSTQKLLQQRYEKQVLEQEVLENQRQLTAQINTQQLRLPALETEYEMRKRLLDRERSIANYERDRAALQEGESCPLCLSTEHPFRTLNWKPKFVDEAKQYFEEANENLNVVKTHLAALEKKQEGIAMQAQLLQKEIPNLSNQIETAVAKANDLHPAKEQLPTDSQALATVKINYQKQLDAINQNRQRIEEIDARLNVQESRLKGAEEKFQKLALKSESDLTTFHHQKEQIAELNLQLLQLQEELQIILNNYQLKLTDKNNQSLLEQKYQFWKEKLAEQQTAEKKLAQVNQTITELQAQIEERANTIGELSQTAEVQREQLVKLEQDRMALFGEKNPVQERQAFLASLQKKQQHTETTRKQLDKLRTQLVQTNTTLKGQEENLEKIKQTGKQLQTQLLEAIKKEAIPSITALKDLLAFKTEAAALLKIRTSLEQERAKLNSIIHKLQEDLEQEQAKALSDTELPTLEEQYKTQERAFQLLLQSIGAMEEQINQQEKKLAQSKAFQSKVDQQQKEYYRWRKLNDLIGMKNGKKFRVFAQGLTLERLVYFANQHLNRLNPRYAIHRSATENLELEIVDFYQANNRRSMKTLSGGESFLVSLALALGLSELAGRKAQIRSLFIDEGFGTLDEATLDLAISTLENLQATGKTIGVISHVPALKERIGTQINVKKKGSGFSEVFIEG